jgi:hypothetical protein
LEEAEQHLAKLCSLAGEFAIPHGDAACLVGFAKLAFDRSDYPRASRLLAAVNAGYMPIGTASGPLYEVYCAYCSDLLRDVLDPETARATQAEGAALSLKEALDAELIRIPPLESGLGPCPPER